MCFWGCGKGGGGRAHVGIEVGICMEMCVSVENYRLLKKRGGGVYLKNLDNVFS